MEERHQNVLDKIQAALQQEWPEDPNEPNDRIEIFPVRGPTEDVSACLYWEEDGRQESCEEVSGDLKGFEEKEATVEKT
jgi:hypothetical protein